MGKAQMYRHCTRHGSGFILKRSKVSANTANKEIRYLRATFNFGIKEGLISCNPTKGIAFLPVDYQVKFVPEVGHVQKLIQAAQADQWLRDRFPDTCDYICVLWETLGRMGEINNLTWSDVNLDQRFVILYTRKKKGGDRKPRKIPMTQKLSQILSRRYESRDILNPWVFWNPTTGKPYKERKKFMKRLCGMAGIPYFRFHALRHSGASIMENANVSVGSIQKFLGHENRSTTEIYLHNLSETERRAVDIYEKARGKSHTESHTVTKEGIRRSA